jgi:hypothetical protein
LSGLVQKLWLDFALSEEPEKIFYLESAYLHPLFLLIRQFPMVSDGVSSMDAPNGSISQRRTIKHPIKVSVSPHIH